MKQPAPSSAYMSWNNNKEKAIALSSYMDGLKKVEPVLRSQGSNIFYNIAPNNTSVRDGFDRADYESFRSGERLPVKPKEVIYACEQAYKNFGIIRNIIDLMSDFAIKGIDINHKNESIQNFYKAWFKKVNGRERSERFIHGIYKGGQVIVKRQTAKLKNSDEQELKKAVGAPDTEIDSKVKIAAREIPWRYTFLNPLTVELLGEEIAPFLGKESYRFAIKLTDVFNNKLKANKEMIKDLPKDIQSAINTGKKLLPLDKDKIVVFYYKKDDWDVWANPMISSILPDLQTLEKLRLADKAALDGVISSIRIWKLGDIEAKIIPTPEIMLRLAEMLTNNVGGGVMDLVWGPDIKLEETSSNAWQFLGTAKYDPVINSILQALGIPSALSGTSKSTGFTNNYLSLKTLTERLEYGRMLLKEFWAYEIELVQKAMGFRSPAELVFDDLLSDEASEKQLWLNMYDRDLVSIEAVQERFGVTPEIEAIRIKRESQKRKSGDIPEKVGPFIKDEEVVGAPGQGRPINSNDKKSRKTKTVKPRSSASLVESLSIASNKLNDISKIVTKKYLKSLSKKTLRELTDEEADSLEEFKFSVLCQFDLDEQITEKSIAKTLESPLIVHPQISQLLKLTVANYVNKNGCEPNFEVMREFYSSVYTLFRGEYD